MILSKDEIDDILYDEFDVYKREVRGALWLLSDKNENKFNELLLSLATKILKEKD